MGSLIDVVTATLDRSIHADPKQASILALAYIGDTVYDLYVRTALVTLHTYTPHQMHKAAAKYVCAKAQAQAFLRLKPMLTEDEVAIFKRGRNAHMGTVAKNASISDYRHATGLEALVGYLYLSGSDERLTEVLTLALEDLIHG